VTRILLIAYTTYVHDGRVKRHAEALAQRGDHVDVLCLDSGHNGSINGVNVVGLRMPRYRGARRSAYVRSYLRFFAMAAWAALRLSLVARYDVVIVCTMPDAAILCALPARLFGSRILLDIHDTMPELYRDKFGGKRGALGAKLLMVEERASARCADAVLAVHEPHRMRLVRAGVPPHKIRTVMNAPDPAVFRAGVSGSDRDGSGSGNGSRGCGENGDRDSAIEGNGHGGVFRLACHGTLTHRLGLDIALEALAMVRPAIAKLRMDVIGTGDYADEAKCLAARLGLADCVRFIDPVPVEQLPRVLGAVDVGLVPNRASSATHLMLPTKLLDYAALGIPTIAARLRTIEHYFGCSAVRFFEPGDPGQLAAAIEELYRDPVRRAALARNARRALERIGWPAQRIEYYRAIDSLLGEPRRAGPAWGGAPRETMTTTEEESKWSTGKR
jgi:glycosyltransferase involved in cell wall biosynthesis